VLNRNETAYFLHYVSYTNSLANILNMKNLKILLFIFLISACKSDDSVTLSDDSTTPIVSTSDFMKTIDENPEQGLLLGRIEGNTNTNTLRFNIDEQSHPGALAVDSDTGDLIVSDSSYFDFETNQEITGTVIVSNGDIEDTAEIVITIEDVFIENDLRLSNLDYTHQYYGAFLLIFNDGGNSYGFENNLLNYWSVGFGDLGALNIRQQNDGNKITEYTRYNFQESFWQYQVLSISYNSDNQISGIDRVIERFNQSTIIENFSLAYNGNVIEVTNIDTNSTTRITLNDDGLPLRLECQDKFVEYVYDNNGNLVSKNNQNGDLINYTYDNKRNPYLDIAPLNWNEIQTIYFSLHLCNYRPIGLTNYFNHGTWSNQNNLVNLERPVGTNYEYSYEYNSDGYPVYKTFHDISSDDDLDIILQFEYN